jgi:uncharacterized protein
VTARRRGEEGEEAAMKKITPENLEDLLAGAHFLGCGGGGEIGWGRKLLGKALDEGLDLILEEPDSAPDDHLLFIIGAVGGGVSEDERKKTGPYLSKCSPEELLEIPILKAVEELSEYLGREPQGFVPTEIGAGNMAVTLYAASRRGIYVIDGDCCGRAKPMISISTTRLGGLTPWPLAAVNAMGDVMIVKEAVDDERAEDIVRSFAVSSGGICFCARCPAKLADYRRSMIPGSFDRCMTLGHALLLAKARGADPLGEILAIEREAALAFSGIIRSHRHENKGGFITGWLDVAGERDFGGKSCSIWFKNEFGALFIDGRLSARVPDLILVQNRRTGYGVSNWSDGGDLTGDPVHVIRIPAHPIWKTEAGRKIFSLDAMGFKEPADAS